MIPLALSVFVAAPAYAQSLRVRPLVRGGEVLVSFALEGVFTDAMRAQVQSGLRTTFTYTVELKQKAPAWVDRTIASAIVSASVEYDNLTRRYSIERMIDGRVDYTQVTDDEAAVRLAMTAFRQLPLFRTSSLEPNREYYVRITAVARPSNGAFLWPWGSGTSGQRKFTFVR